MLNYYYKDDIQSFIAKTTEEIIGQITISNQFDSKMSQNKSWEVQIPILKEALRNFNGTIFIEFSIPRMGKRVDALVIIKNIVFVIEYKVGERKYHRSDIEQVWDYALDLKNFHEPSHKALLVPVLVATEARQSFIEIGTTLYNDNLLLPLRANKFDFQEVIKSTISFFIVFLLCII